MGDEPENAVPAEDEINEGEEEAAAQAEEEKPAADADAGEAKPKDAPAIIPDDAELEEGCPKKRLETRYQVELKAFQTKLEELFSQKRDLESEQVTILNSFNGKMTDLIQGKTKLENNLKDKTKEIKDRIKKFQDTEKAHEQNMNNLSNKIADTRKRKDDNQAQYYTNFLDNKLLHESSFRKNGKPKQPAGDASSYPPDGLSAVITNVANWIKLGLGNDEFNCPEKDATFPADTCPDQMPDLSQHNSCLANQLKKNPGLWGKLKDLKTASGVTFAKCIKTGIDNKGLPTSKTVGIVAGDEQSYEVFKEIFDPIIEERHQGFGPESKHPNNRAADAIKDTEIDASGEVVIGTRIRGGRGVKGWRLPPSCSFDERREIEKSIVTALNNLDGDLEGEYFPLQGSRSWEAKPDGMSQDKADEFKANGALFKYPESTVLLSSGMGRHWPDARGVWQNKAGSIYVWINEEDHLRIISMQQDADFQKTAKLFIRACDEIEKSLKADGKEYMYSERLGYILNCPSNLGTGMRASAIMMLPLLSAREDFKDIVFKLNLQARSGKQKGEWDISNKDRIGVGEVDLMNIVIDSASQFVKWEQALKNGDDIAEEVAKLFAPATTEEDEVEEG